MCRRLASLLWQVLAAGVLVAVLSLGFAVLFDLMGQHEPAPHVGAKLVTVVTR